MATIHQPCLWRSLRHTATLAGVVALAVATTLLTQRFLIPAQVHAQASVGVVQATEFDLLGQNGTVLARLQTGQAGNANLTLYDTAGNRRSSIGGDGTFIAYETDGVTLRFRAGYDPSPGPNGRPPLNGVIPRDANGSDTLYLTTPAAATP